jgi:transcriptional regulator with XRE-family HTH domain
MAESTEHARQEQPAGGATIGARIKKIRTGRMTQAQLAERSGLPKDTISKIEQGTRKPSMTTLQDIAKGLDVEVWELMPRRRTLNGGGDAGAVAIREALTPVADLIDDPGAEPLTVADVERAVTYGWGSYWGGRYDQLGELLPETIARARATLRAVKVDELPAAADATAQILQIAASTLVHLGFIDAAHGALREALAVAERGHDPLRVQALRSTIAWVLLAGGRWSDSQRLATKVAQDLEPVASSPLPQWTLHGSALLSAATAAGRDRDRDAALQLVREAAKIADHTGQRGDYEVHFGADQVTMQHVDIEIVTERYSDALRVARTFPRESTLPLAARARHLSDVGLAQTRLKQDGKAVDTLLAMRGLAPTWMRYQAQPRLIVTELRERATPDRLTELAEWMDLVA